MRGPNINVNKNRQTIKIPDLANDKSRRSTTQRFVPFGSRQIFVVYDCARIAGIGMRKVKEGSGKGVEDGGDKK